MLSDPSWAPDGALRFLALNPPWHSMSVWDVELQTGRLARGIREDLPEPRPLSSGIAYWMPDGRNYLWHSCHAGLGSSLWTVGGKQQPSRLTDGPLHFWSSTPDPNGRTLYSLGGKPQGELVRLDSKTGRFLPFLSGPSAECVEFSPDHGSIVYVTYPGLTMWWARADGSDQRQISPTGMDCYLPRWSPDGKTIAFAGRTENDLCRIYTIPAGGGAPKVLIKKEFPQSDANWSPEGSRIVYAPLPWEAAEKDRGLFIVDIKSGRETMVPGSARYFSPRWSPDGRFLVSLSSEGGGVVKFDFETQKWANICSQPAEYPTISHDSKYVYFGGFVGEPPEHASCRVRVADGVVETVARLNGLRTAGSGFWFGLTWDDSPMILRDLRTEEIYALDLEQRK